MTEQKILQLFQFYPGRCPHCDKDIIITPSGRQLHAVENLQLTTCVYCNQGIECHIAHKVKGKLQPVDLSKYDHLEPVKAHRIIINKAEGIVINPADLVNKQQNKA